MRAMQNPETATTLLDGFKAYYNFIRPHQGLSGKTPAQKAGIELKLGKNPWVELIRQSVDIKMVKKKFNVFLDGNSRHTSSHSSQNYSKRIIYHLYTHM